MNGNRYLLDTNAIIALLKGDSSLIKLIQDTHWRANAIALDNIENSKQVYSKNNYGLPRHP
jgi:predicted nucleic acid-binding protein